MRCASLTDWAKPSAIASLSATTASAAGNNLLIARQSKFLFGQFHSPEKLLAW